MINDIAENAEGFSKQLLEIAVLADVEISRSIRKGVLDLFRNIIKRSPVDTGAYRASHSIANYEPGIDEGVVVGEKGKEIPESEAISKSMAWTWKVGDGDIFIFNNVPYAERIENGWSSTSGGGRSEVKAPEGVYSVALAEFNQQFARAIENSTLFDPAFGGGEEK